MFWKTYPDLGATETSEAINAAEVAQKAWAARPPKIAAMCYAAGLNSMMANKKTSAAILTAEQGKSLAEATGEIGFGASFAKEARRAYGDITPTNATDKRILCIKQPIGGTDVCRRICNGS